MRKRGLSLDTGGSISSGSLASSFSVDQGLASRMLYLYNRTRNFFRSVYGFSLALYKWLVSKTFAISCIIFVLMDVMTTVYYKRFIDHSRNYVMFSLQVMIGTFWILLTVLALLCFVFKYDYMMRPFEFKPMVVLGFLDMLTTGLSANGSTHTSGLMLVLLGQISVPLTMLACKLMLSKKYHVFQYVSSAIILLFSVLKPLVKREDTSDNRIYNNVLYLLASVPDCVASALREKQYTSKFFHVIKYQFYGFSLHFFYNILYTLFTALPAPSVSSYFSYLYRLYVNGFKCIFFGQNSIVKHCGPFMVPNCDDCKSALKIFCLYVVFSTCIRVAYVYIMLDGSVTFTLLLGALKVPLTSIAFSLRSIAGDSASELDLMDIVCFVGIVLGLLLYTLGSKKMQEQTSLLDFSLLDDPELSEMDPLTTGTEHLMQSETSKELLT